MFQKSVHLSLIYSLFLKKLDPHKTALGVPTSESLPLLEGEAWGGFHHEGMGVGG